MFSNSLNKNDLLPPRISSTHYSCVCAYSTYRSRICLAGATFTKLRAHNGKKKRKRGEAQETAGALNRQTRRPFAFTGAAGAAPASFFTAGIIYKRGARMGESFTAAKTLRFSQRERRCCFQALNFLVPSSRLEHGGQNFFSCCSLC